jgi:hypothetical protein
MLSQFLRTLPDAKNPFESWGDYLKAIELEAKRIGALSFGTAAPSSVGGGGAASDAGKVTTNTPKVTDPYAGKSAYEIYGPSGGLGAGVIAGVNVKVFMDGKEMTSLITDAQVNDTLSGTFSDINRVAAKGSVGIR